MMWRAIWYMTLVALALTGCHPLALGQPDVVIAMITSPGVPVVGPATATVFLRSTDGQPIRGAAVRLEGTPTFPHAAPVVASASELAPGVYRAQLVWPRAGSWLMVVHATLANGETVLRQVDLPYVHTP